MADEPAGMKPVNTLRGWPLAAALAALLLWVAFVGIMIFGSGTFGEIQWTRLAFLLASVEAVAFGAGGALWGTSIQRDRAEKAEASAEVNRQSASNGRALAAALVADESTPVEAAGGLSQPLGPGAPAGVAVAQRHARLARSLFPDM
jgi:hypothetical protein